MEMTSKTYKEIWGCKKIATPYIIEEGDFDANRI